MKKITAFFLAVIMLLALGACATNPGSNESASDIPERKALPDDAVLDVMIASHPSWPYEEDFEVCNVMFEKNDIKILFVGEGKYEDLNICGSNLSNIEIKQEGCQFSKLEIELEGGESEVNYESKYLNESKIELTDPTKEG